MLTGSTPPSPSCYFLPSNLIFLGENVFFSEKLLQVLNISIVCYWCFKSFKSKRISIESFKALAYTQTKAHHGLIMLNRPVVRLFVLRFVLFKHLTNLNQIWRILRTREPGFNIIPKHTSEPTGIAGSTTPDSRLQSCLRLPSIFFFFCLPAYSSLVKDNFCGPHCISVSNSQRLIVHLSPLVHSDIYCALNLFKKQFNKTVIMSTPRFWIRQNKSNPGKFWIEWF